MMRGMFLIILFVGFLFEHELYSQLILVGRHQGVTDLYYDASLALWLPSWITLQISSLLNMQHWEIHMGSCYRLSTLDTFQLHFSVDRLPDVCLQNIYASVLISTYINPCVVPGSNLTRFQSFYIYI